MWPPIPICCWPLAWLSLWWAGAATATASRLPMMPVLLAPPRLRTPLLRLHVSTLRLNPRAGLIKRSLWLQPRLRLVKPGCEDS